MAVDTGLTGLINRPRTIHRGSCSDGGHFVDTNTVLYVTFSGQTPTTVQQIPQGDVVYATKAVKAAPNRFVGQWQQVLATGRLPQTGVQANHYYQWLGFLTLMALLLGWQVLKLMRERGANT